MYVRFRQISTLMLSVVILEYKLRLSERGFRVRKMKSQERLDVHLQG